MFGVQDPVGGVRKGASTSQGNKQPGDQEILDIVMEHIQKGTLRGTQNALEAALGLGEALRLLEGKVDRLWSSAASMGESPYRHVHGVTPHESILLSAIHLGLRDGSVLHGLCQKADGSWLYSKIDLNTHYGNRGGEFISGGAGFKSTGRRFKLEHGGSSLMLKGELYVNGGCIEAEIDLSLCIVVKDGKLVFEQYDGTWRRDGWLADIAERIPVVGYIIALFHSAYGNQDQARRAVARCTSSNIVTAAALAGKWAMGPLGSSVAAFLATPLAILARNGIANGIEDPRIRAQFEVSVKQAFYDSLKNAVAGEFISCYAVWLAKEAYNMFQGILAGAGLALAFIKKSIQSWWKGDEKVLNEWMYMAIRGSIHTKNKV